jgi:hypothetical protein
VKRRSPAWLALVVAFAVIVAVMTLGSVAHARPGGGDSFSGGGGHSSSGGGSGSSGGGEAFFELIYWTLRLCFYYPQVGLPLLGSVIAFLLYSAYKQHQNRDWDSGPPVDLHRATDLAALREFDPDFSQIVFEDFAYRLFSTAHRARAAGDRLASVAPYVSEPVRESLAAREPVEPVRQVIVGAMRTYRFELPDAATDADGTPKRVRIGIEFEANVAFESGTYYSVETWMFARDAAQKSKPPGVSRTFPCPNCGAPWQSAATGTQQCASCGQVVDNGRFDWIVEQVSLLSNEPRPPTLTTTVPERGTDLATYRQYDVNDRLEQLCGEDPELTLPALDLRLRAIYRELNTAWSQNDLRPARPFVSDGMYDYLAYWVDAYKQQGLRNALVDMEITKREYAKVVRDRWYDAITIRIWGTGKDYVIVEKTGKVVRGSKHLERPYSEYWTLVRSAQRRGAPHPDARCGNCGAPLRVNQSGECEHCSAHVTLGEFDWVLSKIEQDDTYRG